MNRQNGPNKFLHKFWFLIENFILNEIEESEKISLPTTAFKEDTNMFSVLYLKKCLVFGYGHTVKLLLTN